MLTTTEGPRLSILRTTLPAIPHQKSTSPAMPRSDTGDPTADLWQEGSQEGSGRVRRYSLNLTALALEALGMIPLQSIGSDIVSDITACLEANCHCTRPS